MRYEDGCVKADNIGKGHTYLEGCSKKSKDNLCSAPNLDNNVKPEGVGEWESRFDQTMLDLVICDTHGFAKNRFVKDFISTLILQEKAKWKGKVKGKIEMLKYEEQEIEMAETGLSVAVDSQKIRIPGSGF